MAVDPLRVKALFQEAIARADPAERLAFLDRELGDDAELRTRIDALLAAYDKPPTALDRPLAADFDFDATRTASTEPFPDLTVSYRGNAATTPVADLIAGRYKMRQEIGEGGMGTVFLAEQTQPVKRMVALKLIKKGMDSRTVLARFETERQALAMMDHPNIAKVLDAGTTESGQPFFVMELVKGVPLTEYCDQHHLAMPDRLALFQQICSAVQHAHQKGIIHRDLKPSNILVESHDGKPVPKVIDFGLAKATSGMQLTENSLYSVFGSVAGTPLYMAPEQASFNAIDIDTRADVYALGVILYELLTGSTPIQRETFKRAALDEMMRVIRDVEPPTPSSRIDSSDTLPSVASNRHIEPSRLGRFVRGDLDWIVMKALSKERQRRYDSPIAFSDDIERFLNHEPVTAGPPSSMYRLRKFVRRNRPQVIAASLILLALVAGIIGTTLGLIEARSQRQRADKRLTQIEKINAILGSVFKDLDPKQAEEEGEPLSAILGKRLGQATSLIEAESIGEPLRVAQMQQILGQSLVGLGYPEKAIPLFVKARAIFATKRGADDPETLSCMSALGIAYQDDGKLNLAVPLFEEILARSKAKLGPRHADTLSSMNDLAEAYRVTGKMKLARSLHEETLALRTDTLGPDHLDTVLSMGSLAAVYVETSAYDQGLALMERALPLLKIKRGPNHSDTLVLMGNLAASYSEAGKLDRALPLLEESLASKTAKLGLEHPEILVATCLLAHGYEAAGALDRAIPLYEQTLARQRSKIGLNHPDTLITQGNLARAYLLANRPEDAARAFPAFLAWQRTLLGPESSRFAMMLNTLGRDLIKAGQFSSAETKLRECLAIREKTAPGAWTTFNTKSILGESLLGQKKYAEAEPLLRMGYEGIKAKAPQANVRLGEALDRLIALAEATQKPDDAKMWKDERAKLAVPSPKPEPEKK